MVEEPCGALGTCDALLSKEPQGTVAGRDENANVELQGTVAGRDERQLFCLLETKKVEEHWVTLFNLFILFRSYAFTSGNLARAAAISSSVGM